ncbi:hypothetical protein [Fusibacter sp. JL216-2]|uniref:hypothetical protein n=1 Tax=Fusibacter sp. JL216-2 TaxID=3071453 RepID=UPI003D3502C8
MSVKRYKKMMEERDREYGCHKAFKFPIEICSIVMVAISAVAWLGMIGVKKAGGKMPWEQ